MRPIIKLTSVTYAIRAQKLLEQHRLRTIVRKLTGDMSTNGCGYGLEVHADLSAALKILQDAGIRVVEIIDR